MAAYYNEIDSYAAAWLRNLISAGHIPAGDVDERSITEVTPDDLQGYRQVHLFAGLGGWAYAARLAGLADDFPIWTGSCPCQPFSVAGSGRGADDDRHLWPEFFRLISECRPPVVMGEQVAAAVGKHWLDGVFLDLEGVGYACGAAVVPACAVDAPHRRDRLWFIAKAGCGLADADLVGACEERLQRRGQFGRAGGDTGARDSGDHVAHAGGPRLPDAEQRGEPGEAERGFDARAAVAERGSARGPGVVGNAQAFGSQARSAVAGADFRAGEPQRSGAWSRAVWIVGADGKARRVGTRFRVVADGIPPRMAGLRPGEEPAAAVQGTEEMIPLLARDVPARVGKLKALGNAIVPQVGAEIIGAYLDCLP